jgi:hypothetical protein
VIYVPSFIQIGSGVQKLIGEYTVIHTNTHIEKATWSHKPILSFQNREIRLKISAGICSLIAKWTALSTI